MKPLFNFLIAAAAFSLAGCATVATIPPKNESGHFPEVGAKTTVTVGQVMVSEYDFLSQTKAVALGEIPGSFWASRQGVSGGSNLELAVSQGREVYCQPPKQEGAPCLADSNDDKLLDRAYTMNAFGMLINGRSIDPVAFKLVNQEIQQGFKYELLYQGLQGNVARIAYREYTESLARPAFHQDLTYTLAEGSATPVRFRDVSLTILRADNNSIEYTVESGF